MILIDKGSNDHFQIDLFAQREVRPAGRGEVLHRVRTPRGRHLVRHDLQVLLQRALRPPGDDPPQPQPPAGGRGPVVPGLRGFRVLSWERFM